MVFIPGRSGNPKGRPRRDAQEDLAARYTKDGWHNVLTGHGTSRDKRMSTQFCADVVTYQEAVELYRGDDLPAKLVDTLPNEMTREGWDFCVDNQAEGSAEYGAELSKMVADKYEQLGLVPALNEALRYERAYGGSAILLGADDGQETHLPLNVERVRSFEWVTVLEACELAPIAHYTNPRAPKFGEAAIYQLTPIISGAPLPGELSSAPTLYVHESRLITFGGIRTSRRIQRGQLNSWGDNVFTRVRRVLADFNLAWGSAGHLVADFSQAVMKIKGLHKIMQTNDREQFEVRMRAVDLSRSTIRATLLDTEESLERQVTPMAGLPELLDLLSRRWCAACDTPFMIVWGESPGGINASGASSDQMRA